MKKLYVIIALVMLFCFASGCQKQSEAPIQRKEAEEATSGTIDVDGFELSYIIEGSGIPCVIVEEGRAMKRALSENLKQQFKFIFLSGRHTAPYDKSYDIHALTLEDFVDDVERVRQMLEIEKICVFGHSIWGLVALEYGRRYPDHTMHIIMNGTPPYFGEMAEFQKMVAAHFESYATDERKAIHMENLEKRRRHITDASPGRSGIETYIANAALYWHDPKYDCSWLFEGITWNNDIDNYLFNSIMPGYDITKGHELTIPIFLSLGVYDFVVPHDLWDEYKDKLSNFSFNLFEKSGHWAFLEENELFDKKLIDWIGNQ
jgi:proline iminopeptidase